MKHGIIMEYKMKKLIVLIFLLISGVTFSQSMEYVTSSQSFDTTTVRLNFGVGFPLSNVRFDCSAFVALDSIKMYGINDANDTVVQRFTLNTSDTVKALLTGFTGNYTLIIYSLNPLTAAPYRKYLLHRANAVPMASTRTIRVTETATKLIP